MSKIMTAAELVQKVTAAATNHKTLYVMGGFGAPLNAANKARYTGPNAHEYNLRPANKEKILAASDDTFAFDCVGLIKGLLWGWAADTSKNYGGATYQANGVPDINADSMIGACSDVSTNFAGIVPGEAVWKKGHIGIYVGDGLAVECTPAWYDKVQITAVGNLGGVAGYSSRTWTKHGKLPWVDYTITQQPEPAQDWPFTDVPEGKWYTDAAHWAYQTGIAKGTDETHLSPLGVVTRAQLWVTLKAFAKWLFKKLGLAWSE